MALGMTVGELLDRIDSRELTEWRAFELLNGPVSPYDRLDRAAALIAERITYMLSNPKSRQKMERRGGVEQFMPKWGRRELTADGDDP